MPGDYVELGDVCRKRLGMQCQYGSRYANDLCKDLRYIGTTADYHSMQIHRDDVEEYVGRVAIYRHKIGAIGEAESFALCPAAHRFDSHIFDVVAEFIRKKDVKC